MSSFRKEKRIISKKNYKKTKQKKTKQNKTKQKKIQSKPWKWFKPNPNNPLTLNQTH